MINYTGIDLGTTNSALAYGRIGSDSKFITNVCEVPRYGRDGGIESKKTLSSSVYFKKNLKKNVIEKFVGEYAKNQYSKKPTSVMKSVKSYMGTGKPLPLSSDITEKTPEEVSALILQQLLTGTEKKLSLKNKIKDAIITIPASFDADMCAATLKAAELAGLDVKLPNGEYKNILLYEPKAVIYNISNMIANQEIPETILDLATSKNVLVYDLGGGTLDVALYKVEKSKEDNFPVIDEIAVGRYTAIGGDNFDELLSEHLTKEFLSYNGLSEKDINIKEVKQIMESKAETLKIELSSKVEQVECLGNKIADDEEFEVIEMDLYSGYEFEKYITKKEIENVYYPIMGENLTRKDVKNIDNLKEKDVENIIYPILDVLAKAEEVEKDCKIDAVILNGGMTKFYLIKERIERFFGMKPIEVSDPDLSVAKGAAFYKYCLEQRKRVEKLERTEKKQIKTMEDLKNIVDEKIEEIKDEYEETGKVVLNETINLALEKGYVYPLVKAGTELPTGDIEFKDIFYMPKSLKQFEMPFYMGRGKTTELPNRKIASRIIKLNKEYPVNTKITLVVNIDKAKRVKLSGYVGENKEDKIEIEIDSLGALNKNEVKMTRIATNIAKELDPKKEVEVIKTFGKKLTNVKANREEILDVLENIKNQIKICRNKEAFEKIVLDELDKYQNSEYLKGYFLEIVGIIYQTMSEAGKKRVKNGLKAILTNKFILDNLNNQRTIEIVIKVLGEMEESEFGDILDNLLETKKELYFDSIIRSIAKVSKNSDKISELFLEMDEKNTKMDSVVAAIETIYTKKNIEIKKAKKVIEKLLKIAKNENLNAIISLGKILDSRKEEVKFLTEKEKENVINVLEGEYRYYDYKTEFKQKVEVALNMIKGLELTEEEKRLILN